MAIIWDEILTGYKFFESTDVYRYDVDNRPLEQMIFGQHAINDEFEDVKSKFEECATFFMETPATGTSICGKFVSKDGGVIDRVVVSHGTAGASGKHLVDVNINGTTAFTTQANRPLLDFDDADGVSEVSGATIENNTVAAGDIISVDLDEVQTGSPVWVRIDVFIVKTVISRDVADYILSGSPLAVTYAP